MRQQFCALTKVYRFSSGHRLYIDRLSDEENMRIFGKCSNPEGHGHDYYVEVKVAGDIDPETGMVIHPSELDEAVEGIIEELDHKRLEIEVPYFREHQPSGEIMVRYLWDKLQNKITGAELVYIKLWENENNYFEYFED